MRISKKSFIGLVVLLSLTASADLKKTKNFENLQSIIATKEKKYNVSKQILAGEILNEYLDYASGKFSGPHIVDPSSIEEAKANLYIIKALCRIKKNKKKPLPPTLVSDRLEIIESAELERELVKAIDKIVGATTVPQSKDENNEAVCKGPDRPNVQIEELSKSLENLSNFESRDSDGVYLLLQNASGKGTQPRNFRTTLSTQVKVEEGEQRVELTEKDTNELKKLNISGSAQPSRDELIFLADHEYKDKVVVVVDLRLETHVLVNGQPFSKHGYFNGLNWSKSQNQIISEEDSYAQHLDTQEVIQFSVVEKGGKLVNGKKSGNITEWKVTGNSIKKEEVKTEKQMIDQVNEALKAKQNSTRYSYQRIANPDLHRPRDEQVDSFVNFFTSIHKDAADRFGKKPEDVVLHFHCKAGRGRTTTAMVMADAIQNYNKINADELMRRQHSLGGSNLNTTGKNKDGELGAWSRERDAFVRHFLKYVQEEGPKQFKTSWTKWLVGHPEARALTSH